MHGNDNLKAWILSRNLKYFNETMEPTACLQGYEVIRKEYNDQKKVICERYEDHTGKPMISDKGFVAVKRTYDEKGKLISETGIAPEEQTEE